MACCFGMSALCFAVSDNVASWCLYPNTQESCCFFVWLCYAVSAKSCVLSNKAMKYLSGVGLEFYLSQMVVFRTFENAKDLYLFGVDVIAYIKVYKLVVGLIMKN